MVEPDEQGPHYSNLHDETIPNNESTVDSKIDENRCKTNM